MEHRSSDQDRPWRTRRGRQGYPQQMRRRISCRTVIARAPAARENARADRAALGMHRCGYSACCTRECAELLGRRAAYPTISIRCVIGHNQHHELALELEARRRTRGQSRRRRWPRSRSRIGLCRARAEATECRAHAAICDATPVAPGVDLAVCPAAALERGRMGPRPAASGERIGIRRSVATPSAQRCPGAGAPARLRSASRSRQRAIGVTRSPAARARRPAAADHGEAQRQSRAPAVARPRTGARWQPCAETSIRR